MSNQEHYYKRREFISKLSATAISGLICASPISLLAKMHPFEERLAVDPMTAISIAKTSLDVISAFSGSKDSAMSAMMRYQISMLQNIIQQLTSVQTKLLEIQNAVQDLPYQFRHLLEQQFKVELITDVRAAAQRYTTNVLIPSLTNPAIVENSEVKNEINNIIFIADQKIFALSSMEGGIGPHACMIAPLAMSLNIACRTSLNYPREVILSSILRYQQWFDDMLSSKHGSILNYMNIAAQRHDAFLSELDHDRLAIRLQLKNFKLNGPQKGEQTTDPAIIFHLFGPGEIKDIPIDSYGGTSQGHYAATSARALYRRDSNIYNYNNPDLGGFLIGFKRSSPKIKSRDELFNWQNPMPKPGEYYYIHKIDGSSKYSVNTITDMVESGKTIARTDDVSRSKINLKIAEANVERATMMFCAQANIVAFNTRKRIREFINLIG